MFRVPSSHVRIVRRTLPIAVVTAFLALALMGVLMPAASASPAAPYFGPSVPVDRAPAYQASQPSLAVGVDNLEYLAFAAWGGPATGTDVFFAMSADGGRTWTLPVRVNDDSGGASQTDPSLALDHENNILIVWTDGRAGNPDVLFSRSTDGGLSFSANLRVNDVTPQFQQEADVAVDSLVDPAVVHVVWKDNRNFTTGPDIYYANSTDGGLSFNPSSRLNTDVTAVEQGAPAIAVAPDGSVDVLWRDPRNGAKGPDIYFAKSTDRGATWNPPVIVNDDSGTATQTDPAIAVNATGAIFAAWTDYRTGTTAPDIFATHSTNGGSSFALNVRVNDDQGPVQQVQPSLATNSDKVQVAWSDYRTGGTWPYAIYTASSGDGVTWSANMKVNGDTERDLELTPSIGLDAAGDVFVAWLDATFLGQTVLAATLDVVAPSAVAGTSISINQGASASLDGSGSTDNLGIASYAWDFGDGTGATGATVGHLYSAPGVYTATLTVWDYSGNAANSGTAVTVRDTEAPVAHGAGDRTVDEGQPLFFDASASMDNVGVASYAWNFGDGGSATTATASHVYGGPGTYSASLTVTDEAGNTATQTFTVTARAVSPKPSELLRMIQILEGIVAVLAIALALLGWMLFGIRRKQEKPPAPPKSSSPPELPPPEPDPLDMTLPPPPGDP